MIPAIGIMIAAYIITRMVETLNVKGKPAIVGIFSACTIFITVICALALMGSSSPT